MPISIFFSNFDTNVKPNSQPKKMTDNQPTEHKIIEAAKQVFIEKGLENAKMSDIAERAGISRTALNYYYRTKENLFYVLIEQIFDILLPKIENLSLLESSISSKVDKVIDIYDSMLRKNEYMPRFAFLEIQRNPQLVHDFVAQSEKAQLYLSTLGALINKDTDTGEMSGVSKAHLITTFFGLLFVPYLLEPLLAMYRDSNEKNKDEFLDEHKKIAKKLMLAYFQ